MFIMVTAIKQSEKVQVQVQGTTVVAGTAETEYTGEEHFFLESTVRGYHI